LVFRF